MPIEPGIAYLPYPNLQDCLNLARVRVLDAIQSLSGDILTNNQPYTATICQGAFERLQLKLADLGDTRVTGTIVLYGIPPNSNPDPSAYQWVNWSQFFDGTNYSPAGNSDGVPVLPPDFVFPLKLWERTSGQNALFGDQPMEYLTDGLQNQTALQFNYVWTYENDAIRVPGANQLTDWQLRYRFKLPDFLVDSNGILVPGQQVPVMQCRQAMANLIAFEFCNPRGDIDAAQFDQKADDEISQIANRGAALRQRGTVQRMARDPRRGNCGRGW
jgi:hypothetical protein